MDWIYLTYDTLSGKLLDDDGYAYCADSFQSLADAEAYLVAHDCRATIR